MSGEITMLRSARLHYPPPPYTSKAKNIPYTQRPLSKTQSHPIYIYPVRDSFVLLLREEPGNTGLSQALRHHINIRSTTPTDLPPRAFSKYGATEGRNRGEAAASRRDKEKECRATAAIDDAPKSGCQRGICLRTTVSMLIL